MQSGAPPKSTLTLQPKKQKFTLVPQIDRYPWLVQFSQTIFGKLLIWALFCGLIYFYWPHWIIFNSICLFFCIFFPGLRHIILPAAALGAVFIGRTYFGWEFINGMAQHYGISKPIINSPVTSLLAVGFVLLCCFFVVHFSKSNRTTFRIHRPILTVICFYLLLAFVLPYVPVHNFVKVGIWVFLIIFNKYLWFLFYSLVERNDPKSPPFWQHLGLYVPFWFISTLPYHRGASNFQRIKAKTPSELAICRLKGLKLLIWATYLTFISLIYDTVCYGRARDFSGMVKIYLAGQDGPLNLFFQDKLLYSIKFWPFFLNIPPYEYAFAQCAAGNPLDFYWNWLAMILWFFIQFFHIVIKSHAAIAICRMAGYNALRNVYKPLQANSIADFFNRFYYYFKELLVNVFFYPTFLRYFKDRLLLRYFAATMMAACVGNFLYHYLVKIDLIIKEGAVETLLSMHSYLFYCFLLGSGIYISQWRKIKTGKRGRKMPQPLVIIAVLGFYCLINIFAYDANVGSLTNNFRFFFSLFNINIG
jgi:Ca2+/Na+ antiporter